MELPGLTTTERKLGDGRVPIVADIGKWNPLPSNPQNPFVWKVPSGSDYILPKEGMSSWTLQEVDGLREALTQSWIVVEPKQDQPRGNGLLAHTHGSQESYQDSSPVSLEPRARSSQAGRSSGQNHPQGLQNPQMPPASSHPGARTIQSGNTRERSEASHSGRFGRDSITRSDSESASRQEPRRPGVTSATEGMNLHDVQLLPYSDLSTYLTRNPGA